MAKTVVEVQPSTRIINHVIKLMKTAESKYDNLEFEAIMPNLMYLSTLAKRYTEDSKALVKLVEQFVKIECVSDR